MALTETKTAGMNGTSVSEKGCCDFVEFDPTGRYGRYNEILGRGSSKTVYRAFDEYQGIEVAWNQVKLHDFLRSPEQLERLYGEIHLLKTLNHDNIMKFFTSWVDTCNMNINFVTELFASGTLRQYRLKHRMVNMRAVKHWCRQILRGLVYLHSRDPPVIHRDLKCDNIFINGNQGQVKIGDLGLAAILKKSSAAHCVGTPEFMAPEVYEEEYNELVDIYSFGMCVLEMVTLEYPYSECTHPAKIYKKVVSGKKPAALYRVRDPEVRGFVEKCLATASLRLSARDLLRDPFLKIDEYSYKSGLPEYYHDFGEVSPVLRNSLYGSPLSRTSPLHDYSSYFSYDCEYELDLDANEFEARGLDLFCQEDDEYPTPYVDLTVTGRRRREDGRIFLRLRIADKEGRIRNVYFPFDVETDTAFSVAIEMVSELDMSDQDVEKIADMIDSEIAMLVPGWNTKSGTDEIPPRDSLLEHVLTNNSGVKSMQVLQSSDHGSTATRRRFEEITYKVEGSELMDLSEFSPSTSSRLHYTDRWAEHNIPVSSPSEGSDIHCDVTHDQYMNSVHSNRERITGIDVETKSRVGDNEPLARVSEDYENEMRRQLKCMKAKFQMQLRELMDKQVKLKPKDCSPSSVIGFSAPKSDKEMFNASEIRPSARKSRGNGSYSPDQIFTARSFYMTSSSMLPQPLHRATSLPVDTVDFC